MRRRPKPTPGGEGIPGELFHGIPRDAFGYFGEGARTTEEVLRHDRWADAVRAAGYTPASVRKAAETDAGYQAWLAWRERKSRLLAEQYDNPIGNTPRRRQS